MDDSGQISDGEFGEEEAFIDDGTQIESEFIIDNQDSNELDLDEDMEDDQEDGDEGDSTRPNEQADQDDSLQRFLSHKDSIYSIGLHPLCDINANTNTFAISGGGDDQAYIWNIGTGEQLHQLTGHKDSVCAVGYNFNGKLVATGSLDGFVKIWNADDGKLLFTLEGPQAEIEWIDWHPKGNIVLAGSRDGCIWMWNTFDGKCMGVFAGHEAAVSCGGFSLDGKHIISGSEDGTVRVWDPKTSQATLTFKDYGFHEGPINCLASNAGNIIMSGSEDCTSKLSSINTGKILGSVGGHDKPIEAVGFSPVMPLIASGSLDNKLNIYDLGNLQLRGTCMHDDGITKLTWHPTQPFVFTTSLDRTVRMWDGRSSQVARVWKGHQNSILDLALTKDGSVFVTASDDSASLVFKV